MRKERIQFVSDLHLEFLDLQEVHALARRIADASTEIQADYLALCGDITTVIRDNKPAKDNVVKFKQFLDVLHPYYKGIWHICGNHEYYHKNKQEGYAAEVFKEIAHEYAHYNFLQESFFALENGALIAATTLWFGFTNPNVYLFQSLLNDFRYVPGGIEWIKQENEKALAFLSSLNTLDLLITHHGVTPIVHKKYRNANTNMYYFTDLTKELYRLQPKYAIHGHTHDVLHYEVGDTTVMTNPYGYNGATKEFDPMKYVEL